MLLGAVAAVMGSLLLLLVLATRVETVFVALLSLRTVSDWNVLPNAASSALNAAIGLCALFRALTVLNRARSGERAALVITTVLVATWCGVTFVEFHFDIAPVQDLIRIASIVAMAILAAVVARSRGASKLVNVILWAPLPSALVSVLLLGHVLPSARVDGRYAGTYTHPNAAAAVFNICLLVALAALMTRRSGRGRIAILVVVYGLAELSTVSLGGLIGVVVGLLALIVIRHGPGAMGRRIALVLALSVAGILAMMSNPELLARITAVTDNLGSSDVHTNSLIWRLSNWTQYVDIWRPHAFFGLGWSTTTSDLSPFDKAPHSAYVQIMVETGVVGLCIFSVVLIALTLRVVKLAYLRQTELGPVAFATLIAVLVQAAGSNMISYTIALYVESVVLMAALCDANQRREAGEEQVGYAVLEKDSSRRPRIESSR